MITAFALASFSFVVCAGYFIAMRRTNTLMLRARIAQSTRR